MKKINKVLDDYADRIFIYTVLLHQSSVYYNRLKTAFKIPLILISSGMSIVNSNFNLDNEIIRILNITLNITTALILSLIGTLKIEEHASLFSSTEKKFFKLGSLIEHRLIDEEEINSDFVNSIIDQYNSIVEGLDYEIPNFICKRVRAQYAGKKTLPLIINGIKKEEIYRSPIGSTKSLVNYNYERRFSSPFTFGKKIKKQQDFTNNTIEIKQDIQLPSKIVRHNSDSSIDEISNNTVIEHKKEQSPILKQFNNTPQVLDIKPVSISVEV